MNSVLPAGREGYVGHHAIINFDTADPYITPVTARHPKTARAVLGAIVEGVDLNHHNDRITLQGSNSWNLLASGQYANEVLERPEVKGVLDRRAELVERRDAMMRERHSHVVDQMVVGASRGVELGYVLPAMRDRIRDTFARTAVQVVDSADLGQVAGGYSTGKNMAYISSNKTGGALDDTLGHEVFGHAAAGLTAEEHPDGIHRTRVGLDDLGEGLNEALTEHLMLACRDEKYDFATLDPDARKENGSLESGVYAGYRKVLAAFVGRSGQTAADLSDPDMDFLKNFTRAFGEDSDELGQETEYRSRVQWQARAAYGADAFSSLDVLMRAVDDIPEGAPDAQERLRSLTDRIHGPTREADGTLRPGHIDLAGLQAASTDSVPA